MSQILHVHPVNPQPRLLKRAAEAIRNDQLIVYPTDSSYALGCRAVNKEGLERIRRIRQTKSDHEFTLVCRDLSEIALYGRVANWAYRFLKSLTPGPYTFILKATQGVPRRLQDPKRRSVGIRVPDNRVALGLLEILGEPIMSSTLLMPGDEIPLSEPDEISSRLGGVVDLILEAGAGGIEPTTVLDMTGDEAVVVREGKGDISAFVE